MWVTAGSKHGDLTSGSGGCSSGCGSRQRQSGGQDTSFEALAVEQGEVMVAQMRLVAAEVIRSGWVGDIF